MGVTAITTLDDFSKAINDGDKAAMFDFGATWCGPCRTISPVFEKLAEAHTDVAFYSVDIDVAEDVAKLVDIRSVPTFIAFRGGAKVGEFASAHPNRLNTLVSLL